MLFSLGRPFYRSTLYIMLSLVNDGLIPNFQAEVVCIWGSANTTGKGMYSNNLYPLMGNIIGQVGLFSLGVAAQEKENFKLRLKISKCHILLVWKGCVITYFWMCCISLIFDFCSPAFWLSFDRDCILFLLNLLNTRCIIWWWDHNSNTIHIQILMQIQADSVVSDTNGKLIAGFRPWRHEERDTILKSLC